MGDGASLAGRLRGRRAPFHPLAVTGLYSVITVAMTWPLALRLGRDLPGDLGDPAFICWILGSNAQRLLRFLAGDGSALRGLWSPGIFHPEPLTLAYSEHLLPQTVAVLPVYAATGSLILCYNLLFLSTFVLSALGAFLLVRDLTGDTRAGFLAGLVFGFAPLRVGQLPHLQVLSSQWMPWVLWGVLGYVRGLGRGRGRARLAVAAAALLLQNLSCGYYIVYFAPFAVLFACWEMARSGEPWALRRWWPLVAAGAAVGLLTAPFLIPYWRVRQAGGGLVRGLPEVEASSADVYSYLTAPESLRLWGDVLQVIPRNEGALFPTFTAALLALFAVGAAAALCWRAARSETVAPAPASWRGTVRRGVIAAAVALGGTCVLVLLAVAAGLDVPGLRPGNLGTPARIVLVCAGVALLLSPRARTFAREATRSPVFFPLLAMLLAAWLSLGPAPATLGRPLRPAGLYPWLYQHVPGFDALRVPARMGMVVLLFLSVLAGLGLHALLRNRRRPWLLPAIGLVFLAESTAAPLTLNDVWKDPALRPPPRRLLTGADLPPIYQEVRRLAPEAVLAELPFGSPPYEVRYMVYGLDHGRPILNGYSGAFPESYLRNLALAAPLEDPERASAALGRSGATHAIVHEGAWWRRGEARRVSAWLEAQGARRLAETEGDVLFALPTAAAHPSRR